jgi:hypothetical protein
MLLPFRFGSPRFRGALGPSLAVLTFISACSTVAPPTRVLVSKTPPGDRAVQEEGAHIKVHRWELETPRKGLTRGFFVVKNELEWRTLWPNTEADRIPLLPRDLDFSREMLLVSSPMEKRALSSEVKSVIETEQSGVHVYVTQELPGDSCPKEKDSDAVAYDLARVRRIDGKDVRFHIDSLRVEPCGEPPGTKIVCKRNGTSAAFQEKLTIPPGAEVACIASATTSARPIFDRTWSWKSIPTGTFAKMTMASGGTGVTFTPDVFGKYGLELEITDDLQRRGKATTEIEVAPPKDALMIQMVWTKFDPGDDVSTFPRVELHVIGVNPPEPKKGAGPVKPAAAMVRWGAVKDCTAETAAPQPWCTAKVIGPTTIAILDRMSARQFAMAVHYTDERVQGQAVLCVRAFREGKAQTELCDASARKEDSWWDVGSVESESGKTPEAIAQAAMASAQAAAEAAAAAHAASSSLDGGAPAEATIGDAGSSDARASDAGAKPSEAKPKASKP